MIATTTTATTTPLDHPRSWTARERWVRWWALLLVRAATANADSRPVVVPSSYDPLPLHGNRSSGHNRTAWRVLGCTITDRSLEEEKHHRDGVACFQCIPPRSILPLAGEDGASTRDRRDCCQAMDRFLVHRHNTNIALPPPPPAVSAAAALSYLEGCQRGLMEVPGVPSNHSAASYAINDTVPRIPSHVWMWTHHPVASPEPIPPSWYGADLGSTAHVWTCSVWDDNAQQEIPLSNDKSEPTVPTDKDPTAFRAVVRSALSQSGGMHRNLRHSLRVWLPSGVDTGTVDLLLLVYIPSGMFVNVYDVLDAQRSDLRLTLHTVPGAVIDEEQPEFVSPGHAVYVRIRGNVDRSTALEFATKVHFRYPAPVSGVNTYTRVVLLSPTLVDGTLSATTTTATTMIHRLHVEPEPFPPQPPISAWVSAGREGDLLPVLFGTVGVALVGTLVMFRSISRLVVWD